MLDFDDALENLREWWIRVRFRHSRRQRHRVFWMLANYLDSRKTERESLELVWANISDDGAAPRRPAAVAAQEWLTGIQGGMEFWEAMGLWVPQIEQMIVRAGSRVGSVAVALQTVRKIEEIGGKMRAAIMQAIAYPVGIVFILALTVWQFGVTTVVQARKVSPKLVETGNMAKLAVVADFLQVWGLPLIALTGVVVGLAIYSLPRWTGPLRAKFDNWFVWRWYCEWAGTAFVLSLVALFKAGMSQRDALEELEEGANAWLQERISAIRLKVVEGTPLGRAMLESYAFPDAQLCRDIGSLGPTDLGAEMEKVTINWVEMRVAEITRRAQVTKFVGMGVVGLVLVVVYSAMLSVQGTPGQMMKMF